MAESDCPLCMETLEIDDLHFYPCTCGYQICRFCWHRIRTDGNGLCPACRKTYTEDPAMYRALTHDEIQKVKKERKQKEAQHKQKISDNRQHLSNIRVIQRHLVFVVGLSNKMADIEVLKRPEYFGSYGKIMKIVINPNTNYAGPQGPSASAYITYTREDDALKAILAINEMQPPLKIRASLGTTKYCTHYLRNLACPKVDCMYLHDVGDPSASFTKEDMTAGKHQIFEKNLLDDYAARMAQLERDGLYEEYNDQASEHYHSHHHHHHHHMDTNTREDWGESESTALSTSSGGNSIEVVSTPPTRSSWCTKSDDVNAVRNEPSPTDYPVLEARKPSPKQSTEAPPPPQPQARISPQPLQPPEPARAVSAPINTPKPPLTTKPISPVEPVVKQKAELSDTSLDSVSSSQNSIQSLPQSNIQTSQNDISQINNNSVQQNSTQSAQTDPHNVSPNSIQSDRSHTDVAAVSPNNGSSMSQDNLQSTTIQADNVQSNNVQSNLQTSLQDGLQNNFNLQTNNLQTNNLQTNNLQTNNLQTNNLQTNNLQTNNLQTNSLPPNSLQQHNLQQSSLQNNNNNMQSNALQNNLIQSDLHTLLRNNNIKSNLQNSLQNILPNGALNGTLSTGWTTKSFDTPVCNSPSLLAGLSNKLKNNTTTTATAANSNLPFWPSTSDLGLCNLKLPNDDDLGFDPFSESKSGLEDLMASEKSSGENASNVPQPSFNWDSFWPNKYGSGQSQLALNSYSLFGAASHAPPLSNPHMSPFRAPLHHQYPPSGGMSNPLMNPMMGPPPGTNSFPRFSAPQQPRFPGAAPQMAHNTNPLMKQQSFLNQYRFPPSASSHAPPPPPRGVASPQPHQPQQPQPQTQQSQQPQSAPQSQPQVPPPPGGISADKNWQDGLRALLPNINISFSNQQAENKKLSEKWSSVDTPQQSVPTPLSEVEKVPVASPPPPPGFKGFTPTIGGPSAAEPPKQWLPATVDNTPAVPVAPRPAPPPGFGKPADTFPSAHPTPAAAAAASLLNAPTAALNIPVASAPPGLHSIPPAPGLSNTATVPPAPGLAVIPPAPGLKIPSVAPGFGSDVGAGCAALQASSDGHDDPSILWSKVLKDVPKDIENTELAFPLPGEGLRLGSSLEGAPPGLSGTPPPPNHLTSSWNTIVSGNQPTAKTTKPTASADPELVPANKPQQPLLAQLQQPLQQAASEPVDIPLQKQPIFGGQQKQNIKQKPTATVKPLKPVDGFTTVQGNRQTSASQVQQAATPPSAPTPHNTISNASTGSRVSELDDFSADLPSAANVSNVINMNQEYPLATATVAPKTSGAKKKKRKGKDQVEPVAEVTVGRVESERPIVTLLEDERPKKGGKAKKKATPPPPVSTGVPAAVIKASPPLHHKQPQPAVTKAQPQDQPQPLQPQPQSQPIRILKSEGGGGGGTQLSSSQVHTATCLLRGPTTVSPPPNCMVAGEVSEEAKQVANGAGSHGNGAGNNGNHDHEIVSRLTESTEKLLKNVLFETEAIKLNTEQISKDLKSALEKCKESSLSLSDLEKINLLLTPGKLPLVDLDDPDIVDTYDLERQVESARREAKMLEARLNDVIRKNMASELETLKRNTKNSPQ